MSPLTKIEIVRSFCCEHCSHPGPVWIRYDDDEPWELNEGISGDFIKWAVDSAHEVVAVHEETEARGKDLFASCVECQRRWDAGE